MTVYVIQNKSGAMVSVDVIVKNQMIQVLARIIISEILVRVIMSVIMDAKLTKIWIFKIVHVKTCLFGKFILVCKDIKYN